MLRLLGAMVVVILLASCASSGGAGYGSSANPYNNVNFRFGPGGVFAG